MYLLQHLVCQTGLERIESSGVWLSLGADTNPRLIHIVLALDIVEVIATVGPRGMGIMDIEVLLLLILPPAIAELERKASDTISAESHACRILIDLVPVAQQDFCLFLLGMDEKGMLLMAVGVGTGFAIFENCCYLAVPEMRSFASGRASPTRSARELLKTSRTARAVTCRGKTW